MATKVKLRQKPISGKKQSLYLDFYPPIPHPGTGVLTRREFLGFYLFDNPKNLVDKQHNKEVLQLAEQIRQKRDNQLNKPEIYTGYEKELLRIRENGELNFVDYFKQLVEKHKGSTHANWNNAVIYVERFTQGKLRFADLNEQFCEEFREHLLTTKGIKSQKETLSQNTAASYFSKFKTALKQAYKHGYLQTNLYDRIEQIKQVETQRNFLTLEELNKLVKTDCSSPLLKRAALFSSLTGLRYSDIEKLTWEEVEYIERQGYYLRFTQQKTKGTELLPISEQATTFMGERRQPNDKVFEGLKYSAFYYRYLYQWLAAAGITKDITFHSFRHTYATLQLASGTDIYTVSKMLGHRNLQTTQIYTKVVDKLKREAADKIKLDF